MLLLVFLVLHPRKQGWHDLAVKAVVIKERTLAPAAAGGRGAAREHLLGAGAGAAVQPAADVRTGRLLLSGARCADRSPADGQPTVCAAAAGSAAAADAIARARLSAAGQPAVRAGAAGAHRADLGFALRGPTARRALAGREPPDAGPVGPAGR